MNFELAMNGDLAANSRAGSAAASENSSAEISDNELVAQVLRGDETAFDRLFERHKRRVARFAARYFNCSQQVEETIQIAFTNAYFALPNFNGAHEKSFQAWLLRIANNVCLDALRKKNRLREDLLSELTDCETEFLREHLRDNRAANAENAAITKDLASKLLAKLDAEEQTILRLLDAAEMSAAEVAEITGWSISNVKVRAHRARKRLRAVLNKFL